MQENTLLEVLRETNLTVSRAQFVKLDERWNFETTGAPHSRLYFVTGGSGFLKTDGQFVDMLPGNVYFVPPNCAFSCGCKHMEKFFFHVNVSTIEKYDLFFKIDKIYALPYSATDIEELKKLINSAKYIDVIKLKLFLLKTVLEFCDTFRFDNAEIKKYSPLIQTIILYIENNTSIKLTVSDISKSLFISESKIRNTFKKEMNLPIGKYIDDMIFIKARRMLSSINNNISTVSSELGFCDQFYFSRRFKEKFGLTPSEFKKINKIY